MLETSEPIAKHDNTCKYITLKNNSCKNKATDNGKCTYHNNRLNNIINSAICKKLVFEDCDGYDYAKADINHNQENTYIIKKCNDIGTIKHNNKNYCEEHSTIYKYEKPDECVICCDNINYNEEVPLKCGHWFHLKCLKQYNKMQCPMCRKLYTYYEIKIIYDLIAVQLKVINEEIETDMYYKCILLIPRTIIEDERYGLTFIELMFREITMIYRMFHLQYTSKLINKVIINLIKNNIYFNISIKVFDMYNKVIENGTMTSYIMKENINMNEDNEYTLNYDKFIQIIENLYHLV
jgi:hypothetical protein